MSVPVEFWATAAPTLPILALALVVEARTLSSRWDLETPTWLKAFQGLSWSAALILSGIAELRCFSILAGGHGSSTGWAQLVEVTVALNLGVLLVSPAIELGVRAFARPLARAGIALVVRLPLFLRFFLPRWRMARELSRQAKALAAREAALDALDKRLLELGHPECEECREVKAELDALRLNLDAHKASGQELRAKVKEMKPQKDQLERLQLILAAILATDVSTTPADPHSATDNGHQS